jgi:hypothetical protein
VLWSDPRHSITFRTMAGEGRGPDQLFDGFLPCETSGVPRNSDIRVCVATQHSGLKALRVVLSLSRKSANRRHPISDGSPNAPKG